MTKLFTLITGQEVTYKELQGKARRLGIRANQSGDVLLFAVSSALASKLGMELFNEKVSVIMYNDASEASVQEQGANVVSEPELSPPPIDADEDVFEVSYEQPTKLFEYVRADNCVVVFKQNGVKVTVGWSKKDFKCYSHKEGCNPKLMMVQTAINMFKHYRNGRDGDIAQIVRALVHIRQKPSIISAKERQARASLSNPTNVGAQKENASAPKSRRSSAGVIDPEWLKGYQQQQAENYDARFVRQAYEEYISEARVHSAGQ